MNKELETEYHFAFSEPLVCTAIHNGNYISPQIRKNIGITDNLRLREEDPKTAFFTKISANRIIQHRSRFEYDLNRSRDKAFYLEPADAWGLRVRRQRPEEEVIRESLSAYDRFYRRTKSFFDEMTTTFGSFFVYDIHSYNHHRKGNDQPFDSPAENPEIILGTSIMPAEWFPLVKRIQESLLGFDFFGRKLDVRINVKFPGGNFSRWIHSSYPGRVACIAIEFKKIFMDEWTGEFFPDKQEALRQALLRTKPVILNYLREKQ
jgi:hypothetical protein